MTSELRKPTRTLIVEDHALNRCLLRDLLEWHGHEVVEAIGGEDAWTALDLEPPDLVLCDIQIPGGGGERLLARIRADARMAEVPVVAVTALSMPTDRTRLLDAGFDAYVAKPFDRRALLEVVDGFVGRR
ncbi:MAG: response regulator [Pseudomonadota bacterium]|nr:response regulator [Pseudomonadota bacterium]